jgi:hypothetical protein
MIKMRLYSPFNEASILQFPVGYGLFTLALDDCASSPVRYARRLPEPSRTDCA